MPFARYDKNTMEPFAISVIAHSFSSGYSEYIQPTDTDNFDFISPDGLHALQVVSVIPKNEINAYEYEAQLSKGKKNLKLDKVEWAKVNEDGSLFDVPPSFVFSYPPTFPAAYTVSVCAFGNMSALWCPSVFAQSIPYSR